MSSKGPDLFDSHQGSEGSGSEEDTKEQVAQVGVATLIKVVSAITGVPALGYLAVDLASDHSVVWKLISSIFF